MGYYLIVLGNTVTNVLLVTLGGNNFSIFTFLLKMITFTSRAEISLNAYAYWKQLS
jgi:hypothetical protein